MNMQDAQTIYYFPTDAQGRETGEAFKIWLDADGSANLSSLPPGLRETLERFGTPDELHQGLVFPKEGRRFLARLLANANGYRRFRLAPEAKRA